MHDEMDMRQLAQSMVLQGSSTGEELAACNSASAGYGLSLTSDQVVALGRRRVEALQETARVEFGGGILRELVSAFCSSPYLDQEGYADLLAELQDLFYRFKNDTEEAIGDIDLVEAMRTVFDEEAHGSVDYLEGLSAEQLLSASRKAQLDANEDFSVEEAYRQEEGDDADEANGPKAADEIDRVYEEDELDRPTNDYAALFYDNYDDPYRISYDKVGRIGGSSLG